MDYERLALEYHQREPRGKIFTGISKPVNTQKELSLAYSPGVAGPCRAIHEDPEKAFLYTGRGNLVAVISNGTAVLGLGDIGPAAAKPVMEGKAVLFKKFADIDVFDIEVNAKDPKVFVEAVAALEPTFGGINLEDIKAPDCFYIEEELRKRLKIPVFHDDQHGTAIIAGAGLLNALEITGRDIKKSRMVICGSGAAAIACAKLFLELGLDQENLIMCDSKGVLHNGRAAELNEYKLQFARETPLRTVGDALQGADIFVGVSSANVLKPEMLKGMNPHPIIFALANPDPEIKPEEALKVRPDAILATGRSDYPNQVNNVLGFPFIFRGALDVQATTINGAMKMAAVRAIANLAKEDVPEQVLRAYARSEGYSFGKDYLIPKPMDPRILLHVAPAVAKAAMDSGVARRQVDIKDYVHHIERILGPTKKFIRGLRNNISQYTKHIGDKKPRVVIAHGHDERAIKAAAQMYYENDVQTILLGDPEEILGKAEGLGIRDFQSKTVIIDPLRDERLGGFAQKLYERRQRKGVTHVGAQQLLRNPNYFGGMLVTEGFAEGFLTGIVEPYTISLKPVLEMFGSAPGDTLAGIYLFSYNKRLYFVADCTVTIDPTPEELANIAIATSRFAARYTDEPVRCALLSFGSFGSNRHPMCRGVAKTVEILNAEPRDFIFDGEIQADVALNDRLQEKEFPFCRLKGQANVLIFPNLSAANITYKIYSSLTEASGVGPILIGTGFPACIVERGATTEDICQLIYVVAHQAVERRQKVRG